MEGRRFGGWRISSDLLNANPFHDPFGLSPG
jgi:hypothetical protein